MVEARVGLGYSVVLSVTLLFSAAVGSQEAKPGQTAKQMDEALQAIEEAKRQLEILLPRPSGNAAAARPKAIEIEPPRLEELSRQARLGLHWELYKRYVTLHKELLSCNLQHVNHGCAHSSASLEEVASLYGMSGEQLKIRIWNELPAATREAEAERSRVRSQTGAFVTIGPGPGVRVRAGVLQWMPPSPALRHGIGQALANMTINARAFEGWKKATQESMFGNAGGERPTTAARASEFRKQWIDSLNRSFSVQLAIEQQAERERKAKPKPSRPKPDWRIVGSIEDDTAGATSNLFDDWELFERAGCSWATGAYGVDPNASTLCDADGSAMAELKVAVTTQLAAEPGRGTAPRTTAGSATTASGGAGSAGTASGQVPGEAVLRLM